MKNFCISCLSWVVISFILLNILSPTYSSICKDKFHTFNLPIHYKKKTVNNFPTWFFKNVKKKQKIVNNASSEYKNHSIYIQDRFVIWQTNDFSILYLLYYFLKIHRRISFLWQKYWFFLFCSSFFFFFQSSITFSLLYAEKISPFNYRIIFLQLLQHWGLMELSSWKLQWPQRW